MYKNIYFREMQINFMYCNYYIVPENSLKLLSCGKLEKNLINIEILFCDVLCRLTWHVYTQLTIRSNDVLNIDRSIIQLIL